MKQSLMLRYAIFLASTMFFASCKTDCVAGTGCGGPVTYNVVIQAAPANLGAVILSIDTPDETTVTMVSGRSIPAQLTGTGSRKAIVIGAVPGSSMMTIRFSSIPAQPPAVLLTGASANQSGGYAVIQPTTVQLQVTEVKD